MAEFDDFRPAREQDASATLRGFRYQVELSILRWLALGPNQHLELERGEDIDIVAGALTAESGDVFARKLEQVKLLGQKLTLRSSSALETLANAVSHLIANPGLDLHFCYTTNCVVAREKPSPFPGKTPGIELWQQVRRRDFVGQRLSEIINSLRGFLAVSLKPGKLAAETWNCFVDFANDADEAQFLDFVRRFEWSYEAPGMDDLPEEVRHRLRLECGIADEIQVEELYQRLFLYVFRLLTQPGIKRLTTRALHEQAGASTLSAADHSLLNRLKDRFSVLEERVDHIEATIDGLSGEVRTLARRQGMAVGEVDAIGLVSLASPPLVDHLSPRRETVAEVLRHFSGKEWLAFYGLWDMGKTHLTSLVSRELGHFAGWIQFNHAMSASQASMVLRESLRAMGRATRAPMNSDWCIQICRQIGSNAHIVLDDLPAISGDDAVSEGLRLLGDACHQCGVRVLSTSRFRLPTSVSANLAVQSLLEIPVPTFSDVEAGELLLAHGAPESFISAHRIRFINGVTVGHPLLLTLAARFLHGKNWQLGDEELGGLLRGDHAVGIIDEVVRRLCQTLEDTERELLYRISLASGAIGEDVALLLAAVAPPIMRPKECLAGLLGAWVQREADQKLIVSPVVRGIGKGNLEAVAFRGCHSVLGEQIMRGRMSPWDAELAIGHFVQAEDYGRAGTLFLILLNRLRECQPLPELGSALSMWSDMPLPREMDLGLKIMIRASQFWVFPRYGRSDTYVLRDLDVLMGQVTRNQAWYARGVAMLATAFLSGRDFSRTIRYLTQSISVQGGGDGRRAFPLSRGRRFVELLWTLIVNIQSEAHLNMWLTLVESLSADERNAVMASNDAVLGCVVLADRLMLLESRKRGGQQHWPGVLQASQRLQKRADLLGWEHLSACALRTEVNIHGEYLKDAEACEPAVRAFVDDESNSEQAKSLVSGMYGKMLVVPGKYERALPWLDYAIKRPNEHLPNVSMFTLLAAAKCCAGDKHGKAIAYAQGAAEIARTKHGVRDIDAAKAFGELAIALVVANPTREGAIQAYPAWAEAARSLLGVTKRDEEWKDIFVLFGHIHGFLFLLATTGVPPDHTMFGEGYVAPSQGLFFTTHPGRIGLFRESSVPSIMWTQSRYALSAGDEGSASEWLRRAADEIATMPLTFITASVRRDLVPDLLCVDEFAEAIEAGLRASEVLAAVGSPTSMSGEAIPPDTPLEDLIGSLSPDHRKLVDQFAIISAVVPAFFRIAFVALSDRDTARQHARQLAALCRQVADGAADSQYWTGAAEVLEKVAEDASLREILGLSNSFDATAYRALRALGYLASTLAGDPESAFVAQLAVMESLFSWYPTDSVTYVKLLLPYIEAFWTTTFRKMRFRFRSPAIVEQDLANTATVPANRRVRAILRVVRPSFRILRLEDAVKWLYRDQ